MNLKKLLSSLLFILLVWNVNAQHLKIVKDNINCTYGLKDHKGKWAVKAKYTLIQASNTGFYFVWDGDLRGVMNRKGKIVIPIEYDNIEALGRGAGFTSQLMLPNNRKLKGLNILFRVEKNQRYGLCNKKGEIVFPHHYAKIEEDGKSKLMLYQKRGETYYTTRIDTSLEVVFRPIEGFVNLFGKRSFAVVGETASTGTLQRTKAGVLRKDGSFVLRRKYDYIYYQPKPNYNSPWLFTTKKNEVTTFFDAQGNQAFPPKYRIYRRSAYESIPIKLDTIRYYAVTDSNGLFGIMKGDETLVVPPSFNWMEEHSGAYKYSDYYYWLAYYYNNGKMAAIGPKGNITIPAKYDTLVPVPVKTGDDRQRIGQRYHFIFKENGKYGLMTEEGEILEAARHTQFYWAWVDARRRYYFVNNSRIKAFNTCVYPAQEEDLQFVAQQDSILLYRDEKGLIPFIAQSYPRQGVSAEMSKQLEFKTYGNLFVLNPNRRAQLFNATNGNRLFQDKIIQLWEGPMYLEGITEERKRGLLDKESGALILKPQYSEFKQNFNANGYVWANTLLERNTLNYYCAKWALINAKGERVIPQLFDAPFFLNNTSFPSTDGLQGIFNSDSLEWILPPTYCRMENLSELRKYFKTTTRSGKYGMVNIKGEPIADTIYSKIQCIYSSVSNEQRSKTNPKLWFEFELNGKRILMNEKEEWVKDKLKVDSIKCMVGFYAIQPSYISRGIRINAERRQLQDMPVNNCRKCFTGEVNIRAWSSFRTSKIKTEIYNRIISLALPAEKNKDIPKYSPADCRKCPPSKNINYYTGFYQFQVEFTNDISYSLMHSVIINETDAIGMPVMSSELHQTTFNYLQQEGKWKKVELSEIFGDGGLLYDEYSKALSLRDDLNLDCNNTSDMIALYGHKWRFDRKGICIYLGIAYNGREQKTLILPWENLRKYKQTKAYAELFLP